jgi:polyisoprenyl-phosphate glycosyltransferase
MKLAIVSPCFNEHEGLKNSACRLSAVLDKLVSKGKISSDSFILYVNDGSKDNTWEIICELFENNPYVYGLSLAGNVGHQNATMAGLMKVKDNCNAVITIDSDLQDDLSAIERMVDYYHRGYDVVYGVKVSRKGDSFMKRNMALTFYKIQSDLGVKAIYNHADFRLMSNRVLDQLSLYKEKNLYLRGLIPLMGFKSITVDDVISKRTAGKSKYTLQKMLRLAIDGITSFSVRPVHLILCVGFIFLLITFFIFIYVLGSFFTHHVVAGWTSIMISIWFIGSVVLIALGVLGIYVGKIYVEVKGRPLYTIDTVLSKKDKKQSANK